ncbi:putative ABC transport system permease protein [Fontibacillus panacisegetis]|uniref:Putative hemin transport system permease protein HrtB n=1 Tax=Fontibacillus panacisegetis TaxID=670482 RepID=A0A1G7T9E4_9BACL|nr:ABC transporter permease [Fontibacillus panacisegetis]SDG31898.1 putative ABC transport system permease protein [Fontibacillus panacisegetis]
MFMAIRELRHAKTRYILISLIMVLIAWLVLFVTGLAQGLSSDNASSIQTMNADYLVLQHNSDQRLTRSTLEHHTLEEVKQQTANAEATPLGVQMSTVTSDYNDKRIDVTYFAINPQSMLAPQVVEGHMINDSSSLEAVVDRSLKEKGLKLGDVIHDQASGQAFTIIGFTKGQSFSHTPVVHINFADWKSIHQNRSIKEDELAFNAIAVKGTKEIADGIKTQVSGVEVISKSQSLQGIPGYKEEQGSLLMMVAFLFIIAAFVLAVFFYVMTIQKMSQFGVLKAIGAKMSYLARGLISQVLMLSIISLAIGIGLTYGVSLLLPESMPFELNAGVITICTILFLFVSLLGSLLSLYRVAKVDAIEAIGRAA